MQPAAGAQALRNRVNRGSYLPQLRIDRLERARILGVHQLDELERRQRIELVSSRVDVFAHGLITSAAASPHTRAAPLVVM